MNANFKSQMRPFGTRRMMTRALPPTDRTLFQAFDYVEITMADIEDLIECTHRMPTKIKKEYFYANGVDYDKVVAYYRKVKALNETLYPPVSPQTRIKEYARIWGIVFLLFVHIAFQKR